MAGVQYRSCDDLQCPQRHAPFSIEEMKFLLEIGEWVAVHTALKMFTHRYGKDGRKVPNFPLLGRFVLEEVVDHIAKPTQMPFFKYRIDMNLFDTWPKAQVMTAMDRVYQEHGIVAIFEEQLRRQKKFIEEASQEQPNDEVSTSLKSGGDAESQVLQEEPQQQSPETARLEGDLNSQEEAAQQQSTAEELTPLESSDNAPQEEAVQQQILELHNIGADDQEEDVWEDAVEEQQAGAPVCHNFSISAYTNDCLRKPPPRSRRKFVMTSMLLSQLLS
jgi:hypothetical protein